MSHTPGPWSVPHFAEADVDCDCAYVLSKCYMGSVCTVTRDNGKRIGEGGNDGPPLEEAKANARLIAAAPELYDAADNALNVLLACAIPAGGIDDRRAILDVIAMLRAAIAKAEDQ